MNAAGCSPDPSGHGGTELAAGTIRLSWPVVGRGGWGGHGPGTIITDPFLTLQEVGIMPGPPVVENTAARAYVGRMANPVTDAHAHLIGTTSETAGNLSSYHLLHTAEEKFVAASVACLVHPSQATGAEMHRNVRLMNMFISVKDGALHYTVLMTHYLSVRRKTAELENNTNTIPFC